MTAVPTPREVVDAKVADLVRQLETLSEMKHGPRRHLAAHYPAGDMTPKACELMADAMLAGLRKIGREIGYSRTAIERASLAFESWLERPNDSGRYRREVAEPVAEALRLLAAPPGR